MGCTCLLGHTGCRRLYSHGRKAYLPSSAAGSIVLCKRLVRYRLLGGYRHRGFRRFVGGRLNQCRLKHRRQRLSSFCCPSQDTRASLRGEIEPLRQLASFQDIRQRTLADAVAALLLALQHIERPGFAWPTHSRVAPTPRRRNQNPVLRLMTRHRGRFPRQSTLA